MGEVKGERKLPDLSKREKISLFKEDFL